VLDLNDGLGRTSGVPKVDPAVFARFEAFQVDTPPRLQEVAGQHLKIVWGELVEIILWHRQLATSLASAHSVTAVAGIGAVGYDPVHGSQPSR